MPVLSEVSWRFFSCKYRRGLGKKQSIWTYLDIALPINWSFGALLVTCDGILATAWGAAVPIPTSFVLLQEACLRLEDGLHASYLIFLEMFGATHTYQMPLGVVFKMGAVSLSLSLSLSTSLFM